MEEQCSFFNEVFTMLVYYDVFEKEKAHCFRVEATILLGSYFMLAGAILLSILNSFVGKATFQYFWDKECIRKEAAMDESLHLEEESVSLDSKALKKIRPPPVLFTDTFRWLLRPEHLGDRPLKSEQPLEELVVGHGMGVAVPEEKLSSDSSGSWPPQKVIDVTTTEEKNVFDVDRYEPTKTIEC